MVEIPLGGRGGGTMDGERTKDGGEVSSSRFPSPSFLRSRSGLEKKKKKKKK